MGKPTAFVQGTLDLLILRTLAAQPRHGWAIARRIQEVSSQVLKVQQGSLYPALHRLEQKGWIKTSQNSRATGRKSPLYSLTRGGRAQLARELAGWGKLSAAIDTVIERV
ncbi:MAG TPA: PadR family transcriptional regulator [Bryobacteraceae bacterium]|nr:PadR family transcriptional regulator [Bryobacteraceae bacterium]